MHVEPKEDDEATDACEGFLLPLQVLNNDNIIEL